MSALQPFRRRLAWLRWQRAASLWQTALAEIISRTAVVLVALFWLDFGWRLGTASRMVLFALAAIWLLRSAALHAAPLWRARESLVDLALLLQKHHRLDGDLVAALQFDNAVDAAGSPQLRAAVVRQAASLARGLQYTAVLPRRAARRASWRAAAAVAVVLLTGMLLPDAAHVFAQRILGGAATYPSRTQIVRMIVNGQEVPDGGRVRVVADQPLELVVQASGRLPESGQLLLENLASGETTRLTVQRHATPSHVRGSATYNAQLNQLDESLSLTIRLGDAAPGYRIVEVMHRPIIELTIETTPPDYARATVDSRTWHEQQVRALAGSAVSFSVRAANAKRLEQVELELEGEGATERLAFTQQDERGGLWQLPATHPALSRLASDLRFRLYVRDEDGLTARNPITGVVLPKPDRLPTVALSSLHHAVLPKARPTIFYTIDDDFGIAKMNVQVRVVSAESVDSAAASPSETLEVPVDRDELPLTGEYQLDLQALQLAPGDRVMVTVEAIDYRGGWPGESQRSSALEFSITDQAGALRAILQADEQAEKLLSEAIEQELGVD